MSLDNEVQQEAQKRGIMNTLKTIGEKVYDSAAMQKAKKAAAIATVLAAGVAGGKAEGATILGSVREVILLAIASIVV